MDIRQPHKAAQRDDAMRMTIFAICKPECKKKAAPHGCVSEIQNLKGKIESRDS